MTTIIIKKSKSGSYQSITSMGHAGYNKKGRDIVCASISVLFINTVNALEHFCNTQMDVKTNEDTAFLQCVFLNQLTNQEVLLLDTMVLGLEMISQEYGKKYCELQFKEV